MQRSTHPSFYRLLSVENIHISLLAVIIVLHQRCGDPATSLPRLPPARRWRRDVRHGTLGRRGFVGRVAVKMVAGSQPILLDTWFLVDSVVVVASDVQHTRIATNHGCPYHRCASCGADFNHSVRRCSFSVISPCLSRPTSILAQAHLHVRTVSYIHTHSHGYAHVFLV